MVLQKKKKFNPYLLIRDKRNIVEDEGNEHIPFSAANKTYEYLVFVTNLNPTADLDAIKQHISAKLQAKVFLTRTSKPGDSILSLRLYCIADSDDLDFKMPGLWHAGTRVCKWHQKTRNRGHSTQNRHRNNQDPMSAQTGTQAQGQTPEGQVYRGYNANYRPSPVQEQMRHQWLD